GPFHRTASPFDPAALPLVVRDRPTRLAFTGYFGHMWELYAAWSVLPAFFSSVTDSTRSAALLAFASIAAGALGCVGGALVGARQGRARTARRVLIGSTLLAGTIGFTEHWPVGLVVGLTVVWGVLL